MCPVNNFRRYISHLHPMEPFLWQRPLDKHDANSQIWYYRAPIGDKTLGNMMARLSLKYNLSERYTNHSIRVTSLQVLEDNNVEGRHVIRISGHKNTESIKSYARRLSASRKRGISDIISRYLSSSKPNFQLLPNELVREVETNEQPPPQHNLISTNPSSCSARATGNIGTNSDCSLVGQLDDEEIFRDIPRNMLMDCTNTTTTTVSPIPAFRPLFNNCNNCTINFNVYQQK